jgi:hypothetical protein
VRALAELVRLRGDECRAADSAIVALAGGEPQLCDPRLVAHVEHCLRCQAETAAFKRVLRQMHQLAQCPEQPPPQALKRLLDALDQAELGRPARRLVRAAYLGGITVATAAAGAAGMAVWFSRRRLVATA